MNQCWPRVPAKFLSGGVSVCCGRSVAKTQHTNIFFMNRVQLCLVAVVFGIRRIMRLRPEGYQGTRVLGSLCHRVPPFSTPFTRTCRRYRHNPRELDPSSQKARYRGYPCVTETRYANFIWRRQQKSWFPFTLRQFHLAVIIPTVVHPIFVGS